MPTLGEIMTKDPFAVASTTTVSEVAAAMVKGRVGSAVVMDGTWLTGIFTERDVLRRVVARGLDPATTLVDSVMTANVVTCQPEVSVDDCAALMTTRRIRHLPVQGPAGLMGMVTIGDLLAHKVSEQEATLEQMNHYLFDLR